MDSLGFEIMIIIIDLYLQTVLYKRQQNNLDIIFHMAILDQLIFYLIIIDTGI